MCPDTNDTDLVLRRCWDLYKNWGMVFLNRAIGGWGSDTGAELNYCMDLKLSLLYRMEAVAFNLELLGKLSAEHHRAYVQTQFEDPAANDLMHNAMTQQLYLFDNVVFNLVSMFDYLGNLAGYQYRGQRAARRKWKGLMELVRGAQSTTRGSVGCLPDDSEFAKCATAINQELVAKLSERRARVYHERPDSSPVTTTMDFDDFSRSSLLVGAPEAFGRWLERSTDAPDDARVSILGAATWVVRRSFLAVEALGQRLVEEVPDRATWSTT